VTMGRRYPAMAAAPCRCPRDEQGELFMFSASPQASGCRAAPEDVVHIIAKL
jgi:hypothetical protein